jgi:hypothetical protein
MRYYRFLSMAVLIEAINKFPDDGGPESNPAGSGLFSVLSCESPLREPSAEGCLFKFGC